MLLPDSTLQQSRFYLETELRKSYSNGEAASITRLILEHVGYPYDRFILESDTRPGPEIVAQIKEIVIEIYTGKPIQYILGYTYFFDLRIHLTEHVLIPRPETEEMVQHLTRFLGSAPSRILDLGTGSGCIALALKKYYPESFVTGVDISKEALRVAEQNGRINHLPINWVEWDLIQGTKGDLTGDIDLPGDMDLIVSNPPYVQEKERRLMHTNVLEFEPGMALFVPDKEPLIYYKAIAKLGRQLLSRGGVVWIEVNENLAVETGELFEKNGYHQIHILKDIHDKNRFIRAYREQG